VEQADVLVDLFKRGIVGRMRAILALGLVIPLSVCAQTLSGSVVDVDGKPIAEVRINHAAQQGFGGSISDRDGHFAVEAKGRAVVLRKSGYRSVLIPTTSSTDLKIVLPAETPKEFPTCKTLRGYKGITDGQPGFYFPMMKVSQPVAREVTRTTSQEPISLRSKGAKEE